MRQHLSQSYNSLARQLLVRFAGALLVVGLITLGIDYGLVRADLQYQVVRRAESITQTLEFATEGLLETDYTSILQRVVQNYATLPAAMAVAIIDPAGKTLAYGSLVSQEMEPEWLATPAAAQIVANAAETGVTASFRTAIAHRTVLVHILPFSSTLFATGGKRGLAVAALDLKSIEQDIWKIFLSSTAIMLVGILTILLAIGLLLQRIVLGPLHRLGTAVETSQYGDRLVLPSRLPNNEIKYLALTFERVFLQRQQIEKNLTASEARERANSQKLAQTLQELQSTQAQLIQTEKMSSLGQLVAGIAHEINNPANFIYGNLNHTQQYTRDLLQLVTLYQKHYPHPNPEIEAEIEAIDLDFLVEDLEKLLTSMRSGTKRICNIVLSLRNFSRLDEAEFKSADLHEGLESTLLILQHQLQSKSHDYPDIQVIKEYGELPLVNCYPGQLNQVFLNLLSNAIDAIAERYTQELKRDRAPTPGKIQIATQVMEKRWVTVRIVDNGIGIPEEIQQRIFDPFFTTKLAGKGTGLGMSIGYQIAVEKHQGKLECRSTPGVATEFMVWIPLALTQQG